MTANDIYVPQSTGLHVEKFNKDNFPSFTLYFAVLKMVLVALDGGYFFLRSRILFLRLC